MDNMATTVPLDSLLPKPRPLLKICNDTFHRLLATIAANNAHPVEHAVVAADLRSKTLLLAILLPDRFDALRTSPTIESNGVEYPIIAVVEPPGKVRVTCEEREWVKLFTLDGRALRAEPKVKDEVVFRRMELLRCLAEMRREERKRRREKRRVAEVDGSKFGDNDLHVEGDEAEGDVQARKRKRLREKDRRQRARRKEEGERASELKQLEREVIQEGVTIDELSRGFKLVEVGSEVYYDELAQAKKLGLKVVRL